MVRGLGLLSLLTVYTQCCYQHDAVPTMQGWLLGLSGLRPIADRVWDARDWLAPTPMTLGFRV